MPVPLKTYAKRVEDLLAEYRQRSGGKIEIKKFDPQPDSDAEDSARLDGVEGQSIGDGGIIGLGDKVYLGLSVTCVDQKVALPFLDPSRERLLEYDLTRAIAQVVNPQKQNLGVMSGLPIFGQMNPMMTRMGGGPTGTVGLPQRAEARFQRQADRNDRRRRSTTTSTSCWWFIRRTSRTRPSTPSISSSCAAAN